MRFSTAATRTTPAPTSANLSTSLTRRSSWQIISRYHSKVVKCRSRNPQILNYWYTLQRTVVVCMVQVHWYAARPVTRANPRLWAFLYRQSELPSYQPGDLVGVKSKCCGMPRSCSYFFKQSREIMFERVRWTRQVCCMYQQGQ